jgi:glutaredoxin 3
MVEQRRRQVEIFSAGCACCTDATRLVEQLAGASDDVQVLDMKDRKVAELARGLGVRSVPSVVITVSTLAACCASGPGPDATTLRAAGIGRQLTIDRRRRVEVFSAGCSMCEEAVALVQELACRSCDVQVLDVQEPEVAALARSLGIRSVPSVVITASQLATCCSGRGPDEATLRRAGLGQPLQSPSETSA